MGSIQVVVGYVACLRFRRRRSQRACRGMCCSNGIAQRLPGLFDSKSHVSTTFLIILIDLVQPHASISKGSCKWHLHAFSPIHIPCLAPKSTSMVSRTRPCHGNRPLGLLCTTGGKFFSSSLKQVSRHCRPTKRTASPGKA